MSPAQLCIRGMQPRNDSKRLSSLIFKGFTFGNSFLGEVNTDVNKLRHSTGCQAPVVMDTNDSLPKIGHVRLSKKYKEH